MNLHAFTGWYEYGWRGDYDGWAAKREWVDNLIPILQTCRRIYTEIVPLLYSQTAFFFSDPATVSSLAYAIQTQRLNNIHSISIDWAIQKVRLPSSDKAWNDIWDIVAYTQSIREVRLIVLKQEMPNWHVEFQWKWEHEGVARRMESGELKVGFWMFGESLPAIFGECARRNLLSTYQPPRLWGKEWYEN